MLSAVLQALREALDNPYNNHTGDCISDRPNAVQESVTLSEVVEPPRAVF